MDGKVGNGTIDTPTRVEDEKDPNDLDIADGGSSAAVEQLCLDGKKFHVLVTGNTLNVDEEILEQLRNQRPSLQKVERVEESDFVLVFCPVVSRAGTDIDAAMRALQNVAENKPAVLMVLHHTFNKECIVPDSSRAVKRHNSLAVDFLFHEDNGLLQCGKNNESFTKVVNSLAPEPSLISWPFSYLKGNFTFPQFPFLNGSGDQSESSETVESPFNAMDYKHLEDLRTETSERERTLLPNKEFKISTELRLVLVGASERDKNAAKNIILGRRDWNPAATSAATSVGQSESTQVVAGRKVTVVETLVDWFCPETGEMRLSEGPQAFLLVIPVNNPEDDDDQKEMSMEKMEEIFEKRCWRNTMILFTVTDERQKEKLIQVGERKIRELVEKCGNMFQCLNIVESSDRSQVSELLDKIERMLNGNKTTNEIYQMIIDTERQRREEDEPFRKVQHEMETKLKKLEDYIEKYKEDLEDLPTHQSVIDNRGMISELKEMCEIKKEIGQKIKKMYDRVAGLEENKQFIRVILPENQQAIWLELPNQQTENSTKHKELEELEELFSKVIK